MNSILQKIMDQSFTDEQGERFDPERFAELLVKECAFFSVVITDDHYDVGALYKHFGLEE